MDLSRIEKVDIRSQWANEEYDFTPWLAQEGNIQILADEIGIDIEVEDTEVFIGSYKADVVARDGEGRKIIIENQLSKTDHKHLGQILTYASGVDAKIIIWVCTAVTDEHRQAIDWLNEISNEDVAFFACEIELWRIDDSKAAPVFKTKSSPNDWFKSVKNAIPVKALSETKQLHLKFWNAFKEYMDDAGTDLRMRNPWPRNWYPITIGRSKFQITLTNNTQTNRLGCEIYIRGKQAKKAFSLLYTDKAEIENQIGQLDWQELPEGQDCRIVNYKKFDVKEESSWSEIFAWMKERSESLYKVFSPKVKKLNLD